MEASLKTSTDSVQALSSWLFFDEEASQQLRISETKVNIYWTFIGLANF